MSTGAKTQIGALTSTRAIAAVLVVIHHYGSGLYPFNLSGNLFRSGNIAVSYFFVLSGFVLFIAHAGKQVYYFEYLKRRVARIFPLYYVALLLTIGVFLLMPPLPVNMARQVLYSALFIQSYFPGYALSLNLPAWSISIEMLFYLIFPFLLLTQQRSIKFFAALCVCFYVISQCIHLYYFPQRSQISDNILDTVFFNPLIHLNQFMIGMIGGYFFKRVEHKPLLAGYISPLVFTLVFTLIALRPGQVSYHTGLIAPLFMLLIFCIARSRSAFLNLPFFVFLGEISYGVYILQYPVFKYLEMLNEKIHFIHPDLFFYFSLIVLMTTAALLHYTIERPFRRWINGDRNIAIKPADL